LKQNYKASFDIWIVGKESKIIETHSKIQFLQINDTSSLNKIDILKTIASIAEGEIISLLIMKMLSLQMVELYN
jgi:hypothetical protein